MPAARGATFAVSQAVSTNFIGNDCSSSRGGDSGLEGLPERIATFRVAQFQSHTGAGATLLRASAPTRPGEMFAASI